MTAHSDVQSATRQTHRRREKAPRRFEPTPTRRLGSSPPSFRLRLFATALIVLCSMRPGFADVEGFTQPFRVIEVPAADTGVIERLEVVEGTPVTAGQLIGRLNCDLLNATLEIADASRNAVGRRQSAEAEVRLQTDRLQKLQKLLQEGHASQEEVERTVVSKETADAELLTVIEDLQVRDLEHRRILIQIEHRTLRSPIDGVVSRVLKEEGEFVAPNDPVIVHIVQLDPLLATFAVPTAVADGLRVGGEASVSVGTRGGRRIGIVETISPIIDAQSGTVEVKVRLANSDSGLRSGERCILHPAASAATPAQTTNAPAPLKR